MVTMPGEFALCRAFSLPRKCLRADMNLTNQDSTRLAIVIPQEPRRSTEHGLWHRVLTAPGRGAAHNAKDPPADGLEGLMLGVSNPMPLELLT